MTKILTAAAAGILAAGFLTVSAQAAPAKAMHGKAMHSKTMHSKTMHSKMVSLYQADKCHMYFTPAQAKKYKYACPDSHGKMKPVKVSAAVAKVQIAKTNAALAPKKTM